MDHHLSSSPQRKCRSWWWSGPVVGDSFLGWSLASTPHWHSGSSIPARSHRLSLWSCLQFRFWCSSWQCFCFRSQRARENPSSTSHIASTPQRSFGAQPFLPWKERVPCDDWLFIRFSSAEVSASRWSTKFLENTNAAYTACIHLETPACFSLWLFRVIGKRFFHQDYYGHIW